MSIIDFEKDTMESTTIPSNDLKDPLHLAEYVKRHMSMMHLTIRQIEELVLAGDEERNVLRHLAWLRFYIKVIDDNINSYCWDDLVAEREALLKEGSSND